MEAAHQPLTPAAVRVVKLANEIVRLCLLFPQLLPFIYCFF